MMEAATVVLVACQGAWDLIMKSRMEAASPAVLMEAAATVAEVKAEVKEEEAATGSAAEAEAVAAAAATMGDVAEAEAEKAVAAAGPWLGPT